MLELPMVLVYTDNSVKVEYLDPRIARYGRDTVNSVIGWLVDIYHTDKLAVVIVHSDLPIEFERCLDIRLHSTQAIGFSGFEGENMDQSFEEFLKEDNQDCFDTVMVSMAYLNLRVEKDGKER
jgi:hypothetical protein